MSQNKMRFATSDESVILINLLKAKPGKLTALIMLLKQNTRTVIRTLSGWTATRLIATGDGSGIVIYSGRESLAAIEAMRSDPRMRVYFPQILEPASFGSMTDSAVDGEDVLQDVLVKAFRARTEVARVDNLADWLFRIAHKASLDTGSLSWLRARRTDFPVTFSSKITNGIEVEPCRLPHRY